MKKIFILATIAALMTACFESNRTPVAPSDSQIANTQTMDSVFEDTTKIVKIELPTLLDSANQILVHEIRLSNAENKRSSYLSKSDKGYIDMRINLLFEDLINGKSQLLTDKQIIINSYNLIFRPNTQGSQGLIMYNVIDADHNNDGQINYADLNSIYMGNTQGTTFEKITKDRENFVEGNWIYSLPKTRYYFTTREDSNKDGYFDNKDLKHSYYLQFSGVEYELFEYNPLDMIVK